LLPCLVRTVEPHFAFFDSDYSAQTFPLTINNIPF